MEPAPTVEPDLLDRLVTILDAAARRGGWHQPHRLVTVERPDAEGFDLGVKEVGDGEHPLDHLLGLVAPDEWYALGIVSFGWASPAPDDAPTYRAPFPPSDHPDRLRARSVFLVARDGHEASTTALADGRVIDTPGEGFLADALRRALGLATEPADEPPLELLTAMWLDQALTAVRDGDDDPWWAGDPHGEPSWPVDIAPDAGSSPRGRAGVRRARCLPRPSWARVASLHPLLASVRAGGRRLPASRLADLGRVFAETVSWADLRWESMTGATPWGIDVDADLATWMDDGMYARWLLAEHDPVSALAARLAPLVAPASARQLGACLDEWGLGGRE